MKGRIFRIVASTAACAAFATLLAQNSTTTAAASSTSSGSLGDHIWLKSSATFVEMGQKLVSNNKRYEAVMQADGNFVLYDRVGRAVLWATHTNGKGSPKYVLAMQADNNLVLYANSVVTWAKGKTPMGTLMGVSFGPQAPFKLVMQDDGNLVMYDVRGLPFWETATNPGR